MLGSSNLPQWLESLLREKFFKACKIHEDSRKNEKNIFCLDCCESICPRCLSPHTSHRLLQIRRYVYHDVIRLGDADKLMDAGFVQSYTTNSAKVVFLNQREQTRPFRGSGNICITCYRGLQHPYLYCSISCKLQHIVSTGVELSKYLNKCEHLTLTLTLPELGLEDSQITPDSILEPVDCLRTESGSSGGAGGLGCPTLVCTATTEIMRKKRSAAYRAACLPVSEVSMITNRRKGTPHRSPLY